MKWYARMVGINILFAIAPAALIFFLIIFLFGAADDTIEQVEWPSDLPYYYDAQLKTGFNWIELYMYDQERDVNHPGTNKILEEAMVLNATKSLNHFTSDQQLFAYLFQSDKKATDFLQGAKEFEDEYGPLFLNHRFPIHIAESYSITIDSFGKVVPGLWDKPHEGTDIPAPTGRNLWAVANSKVVKISTTGNGGNAVTLQDLQRPDIMYYYAHLSSFAPGLSVGQVVQLNTIIGQVGSTGHTTGPHLHFQIFRDGEIADPTNYLLVWEAFDRYYKQQGGYEWERRDYPPPPKPDCPDSEDDDSEDSGKTGSNSNTQNSSTTGNDSDGDLTSCPASPSPSPSPSPSNTPTGR